MATISIEATVISCALPSVCFPCLFIWSGSAYLVTTTTVFVSDQIM